MILGYNGLGIFLVGRSFLFVWVFVFFFCLFVVVCSFVCLFCFAFVFVLVGWFFLFVCGWLVDGVFLPPEEFPGQG